MEGGSTSALGAGVWLAAKGLLRKYMKFALNRLPHHIDRHTVIPAIQLLRGRAARSLTLRSSGHISNLVRRAADEIKQHRDVAAITEQCLARLRPATIAVV